MRVQAPRAFSPDEGARPIAALQIWLGRPFRIEIERVGEIRRGPGFKFEDFVSEIDR